MNREQLKKQVVAFYKEKLSMGEKSHDIFFSLPNIDGRQTPNTNHQKLNTFREHYILGLSTWEIKKKHTNARNVRT